MQCFTMSVWWVTLVWQIQKYFFSSSVLDSSLVVDSGLGMLIFEATDVLATSHKSITSLLSFGGVELSGFLNKS